VVVRDTEKTWNIAFPDMQKKRFSIDKYQEEKVFRYLEDSYYATNPNEIDTNSQHAPNSVDKSRLKYQTL